MKQKVLLIVVLMAITAHFGTQAQSFTYTHDGVSLSYTISYGNATLSGYDYNSLAQGKVVIPDSVVYESVHYPVTEIGSYALSYNSEVDTIVIPNTVLSIGGGAFIYCNNLQSITIGSSVVSIGNNAFENDTTLASVSIPASVSSIGSSVFLNCKNLGSITVDQNNTTYDSRDNCNAVILSNTNQLVGGCVNTVIPSSVISIGASAFESISGLTSITIPNSVALIGDNAFYNTGLTSITLPNSVTQIGNYCFEYCSQLASVTLGDSTATIGNYAFAYCTSLTSITLPNTLTSLGNNAFNGCTSLAAVTLSNSMYDINNSTFKNCTNLTSIDIPASVYGIYGEAFSGCTSLASVTLYDNPGYNCFIYSEAFKGCTSLASIGIPNSYHQIGTRAFQYCTGLTNVTIGSSVTSIGEQSFAYCTAISEIHSRPSNPPSLGANAFLGVATSIPVYVPCTAADYQAATGWSSFTNYQGQPYVVTVSSEGNGTVSAVQATCEHDTATLTATADADFMFYRWSDGNTDNPRVFHPTSDMTLSAIFGTDTCIVDTLPYIINFENLDIVTNCWDVLDQDGDGRNWERVISFEAPSGWYFLRSASYDNSVGPLTPDNWFVSPAINLPSGVSPILRWYARGQDGTDFAEHYSVYISTTGTSAADFTTVLYTGNTTNSWEEQVVSLAAYTGQTVYIAFRHHNCTNMYYLNLDDITIIDIADYIGEDCIVSSYPYTMGFESTDNLGCWRTYDNDGDGNGWTVSDGNPHSDSSSVFSASYDNTAGALTPDNWLVSGAFSLPADTPMQLSWYAKGVDANDFAEHYTVYISTTGNTPSAFSTVLYSGITTSSWARQIVDLSEYVGQIVFVAFRHHDCTDMYYLDIDDIAISEAVPLLTINVASNDNTMGNVSGGGSYEVGATATLTAIPNSGYQFVRWNDNITTNPRTITVTANATYTAYFEEIPFNECNPITTFPWNATFDEDLTCWKTVDADGDGYNWLYYDGIIVSESYAYFDGSQQGLTPDNWIISPKIELPSNGDCKLSWSAQGMNDSYYNEHYSVYISTNGGNNPSDFTTSLYSETINTPNAVNRTKTLQNYRGQTIRIAFRHHNSNDVFILGIGNIKVTKNTQGIDGIEEIGTTVYADGSNIHIVGAEGNTVRVYTIDGRTIATRENSDNNIIIPVSASGVYMVKVGTLPVHKVVVVR